MDIMYPPQPIALSLKELSPNALQFIKSFQPHAVFTLVSPTLIILSFEILKFSPKEKTFLKEKICMKGNLKSFGIIKLIRKVKRLGGENGQFWCNKASNG